MVYNNKIEVNYRALKKKAKNRNKFRKYTFVSFAVFILSYILIISYAEKVSAQITFFLIAFGSLVSFLYYTSKFNSTDLSLKEWIIYDAQNLKISIIEMDTESINKRVYDISKNFDNYDKTRRDDLHFNKSSRKSKEMLDYILNYIYPTSIQKDLDGEYVIYTEGGNENLSKIITNLDNLTLSIIDENFLDYKFDEKGLFHEKIDINSIQTANFIGKNIKYLKSAYENKNSYHYIINSSIIAVIIYFLNIYFDVLSVKDILYISLTAAVGMDYAKSKN